MTVSEMVILAIPPSNAAAPAVKKREMKPTEGKQEQEWEHAPEQADLSSSETHR
jgi:hypothetical protein